MVKVMVGAALLFMLVGSAGAQEKYGVVAKRFLSLEQSQKMLYAAGVMDTLWLVGVRCPAPTPSYGETIAATEARIWRHYDQADSMWASLAMMAALAERGCKRQE